MDVSKIDKNFAVSKIQDDDGARYYNLPCEPFDMYGIYFEKETERFVRMPSNKADKISKDVSVLQAFPTGGRIRFATDSNSFFLNVKYDNLLEMRHMPLTGSCGFVLLEDNEDGFKHKKTFSPESITLGEGNKVGFSQSCKLSGGVMKNYILYFPLYNDIKSVTIGLDKNAKVSHGKKYKDVKPILYYGSSITQGGCASRPDNTYQAMISKRNNIDFINLGFSGNAKAEEMMCEYLADIDCSVFVCDYDHNAPNPEYLHNTHFALYKKFREKQPTTPIVFMSEPDVENDPYVLERFEIIKETYDKARDVGDKNVYLIDGRTFFDGFDRNACTVDGCHPNDLGFYKMANVIYEKLQEILAKI